MKTILMKAMTTSISDVMETMFFLPIEIAGETNLGQAGIDDLTMLMACQLTFKGDVSGAVVLAVPHELLIEMTENFMGESQDRLTREHISGTLTEMLNMVCGNALSRVEASVPYELGIPDVVSTEQIEGDDACLIFNTLDSKMIIRLKLD